jgi:hypothetical protein
LRVPGDDDHPQQVMSGHTDGVLPHAACLELLRVTDLSYDRVLAGVGCAHRLEPGRRLDPRGRLESYRVFEAVVCGSESFCQDMWRRLERDVDDCLGEILPGGWQVGRDSFHPSMDRKLEWVVDLDDSGSLAVASLNDHHQAFTRQASTQSFCLGIGIDRIAIVAGEDFTYMLTH